MALKQDYCIECGTKLEKKYLESEGTEIPWCPNCQTFRFPVFNTAVIMIVVDKKTERILLIRQYGTEFFRLVAGYVNRGESLETTVVRELKEETGMDVSEFQYNASKFFEGSNTLMVNYTCYVEDASGFAPNEEIDSYQWFSYEDARKNIKDKSLAKEFLEAWLERI